MKHEYLVVEINSKTQFANLKNTTFKDLPSARLYKDGLMKMNMAEGKDTYEIFIYVKVLDE
jgi:hypothetical protein